MLWRKAPVSLDDVLVASLSLVLIAAFPLAATSSTPRFVNTLCNTTGGSYAPNSVFQSNLNSLLSDFTLSSNSGCNAKDVGGDSPNDVVHGLYYCRGDVAPDACRGCIQAAAARVVQDCPGLMEAVIWYDECTLRYANRAFSPPEEETQWVSDKGPPAGGGGVDGDEIGSAGSDLFGRLLAELRGGGWEVSSGLSLYRRGSVELKSTLTLEMRVQCAPQVTESSCEVCLEASVEVIPSCCGWRREWVMVFRPSCKIEYWLENSTDDDDDDNNDDDDDYDDDDYHDRKKRRRLRKSKAKVRFILRAFGYSTAGAFFSVVSFHYGLKPIVREVKKYLRSRECNHDPSEPPRPPRLPTPPRPPTPPPGGKEPCRPTSTIWSPTPPQVCYGYGTPAGDLSVIPTYHNPWDRNLPLYQNHFSAPGL